MMQAIAPLFSLPALVMSALMASDLRDLCSGRPSYLGIGESIL